MLGDEIALEVLHILLRSLNVASLANSNTKPKVNHSIKYNNPVVTECLTLPCLRILNHICKTSTNLSLLSQLATSSPGLKPPSASKPKQTLFTPAPGSGLNRYILSQLRSITCNYKLRRS